MALFKYLEDLFIRADNKLFRLWKMYCGIFLIFRKNLGKSSFAKKLREEYEFDVILWLDYLTRFTERDAKRHITLAMLFSPWFLSIPVRFFKLTPVKNFLIEELYLYYFCWVVFLIYEGVDTLYYKKAYFLWYKQTSVDYKALYDSYCRLDDMYATKIRENAYAKKEIRYLEAVLKRHGIEEHDPISEGVFHDESQPHLDLKEIPQSETSPNTKGSQTEEEFDWTQYVDLITSDSISEASNGEVQVPNSGSNDEVQVPNSSFVNSGVTESTADPGAVQFDAESGTIKFSTGLKREVDEDGRKEDLKEGGWEFVEDSC